jgi:RHS repeat-associated protein
VVPLLQAFSLPTPAPGEIGTPSAALNYWGGLVDGGYQQSSTPDASVNIVIFDKDFKFLDAAWDKINEGAEQVGATPDVDHDSLVMEYTIEEAGIVFLYVSNNDPVKVYFDDVTITHTPTKVIQYNEYYPFGLTTAKSWTRSTATDNKFKYNGGSESNSITNLYETYFRNYDASIGRFIQLDPRAVELSSITPYNYGLNNPALLNDPNGDFAQRVSVVDEIQFKTYHSCPSCEGLDDSGYTYGGMKYGGYAAGYFETGGAYVDAEVYRQGRMTFEEFVSKHSAADIIVNGRPTAGSEGFFYQVTASDAPGYVHIGFNEGYAWSDVIGNIKGLGTVQQTATLFTDPTRAYTYMYNNSFPKGERIRENFGYILEGGGVLVLPTEGYEYNRGKITDTYRKNSPNNSFSLLVPWDVRYGKMFVTHNGKEYQVLGSIHTHPNSGRATFGDMYGKNRSGDWNGLILNAYDVMFVIGADGVGRGWKDDKLTDYNTGGLHYKYEGTLNSLLNGNLILMP